MTDYQTSRKQQPTKRTMTMHTPFLFLSSHTIVSNDAAPVFVTCSLSLAYKTKYAHALHSYTHNDTHTIRQPFFFWAWHFKRLSERAVFATILLRHESESASSSPPSPQATALFDPLLRRALTYFLASNSYHFKILECPPPDTAFYKEQPSHPPPLLDPVNADSRQARHVAKG
jgi:hypothetical protein